MGALIGPVFISASLWGSFNEEVNYRQDSFLWNFISQCNYYCKPLYVSHQRLSANIFKQHLETFFASFSAAIFHSLALLTESHLISTLTFASFFSTKVESAIKLG